MFVCAQVYFVLCIVLCVGMHINHEFVSVCMYVIGVPLIAFASWQNLLSQENLCAWVCVHGLSPKMMIVDTHKPLVFLVCSATLNVCLDYLLPLL